MANNNINSKKSKKAEKLSSINFKNHWPFSLKLAEDLFVFNSDNSFLSFKDFLIYTFSEEEREERLSQEDFSSKDEDQIDEKRSSWPFLKYPGFFIENNIIYFQKIIPQKGDISDISTKKDSEICIYSLENVPYVTIITEATRFYVKSFFHRKVIGVKDGEDGEKTLTFLSIRRIWCHVFCYLLLTPFSSSIKKVLENEKYKDKYMEQIIRAFYVESTSINSYKSRLKQVVLFLTQDFRIDQNPLILKKRFQNLFSFSNTSDKKSDTLITDFFSTQNFEKIASYYKKEAELYYER